MSYKTKRILIIALSVMLIGLIGAMGAIFGKKDWETVKNKVDEMTKQEEVVETSNNILLNSDFSINTTGVDYFDESIITNTGKYLPFIDNWEIMSFETEEAGRDFTMYQTEDGLYCRNDGTLDYWILQVIDEGIVKYADKMMTVSFSVDGVVYSGSGVLTDENQIEVYSVGSQRALLLINIEQGQCRASIRVVHGCDYTINWIQVEEGNVFTGYKG